MKPPSFSRQIRDEIKNHEKKMDKKRAFVRDCFLDGGHISNPQSTYHLEFSLDEKTASTLMSFLLSFGLRPKKFARKGQTVVYLKEADEIADVLKIIRADRFLLKFEEMRVEKAIANNINRQVNFETANLNKTVGAAQTQIEAIKLIAQTVGLGELSPTLQEVACLRLKNESLSLSEIGELLDPPIGKSGVNHRLRKICRVAETLGGIE
ncbi:MAG: DNA-binding protein WhiA [Defluviitaleaceae bacterium]|nr:DNA-binding protein WhiA [Defluviitaleaceae bacterium]